MQLTNEETTAYPRSQVVFNSERERKEAHKLARRWAKGNDDVQSRRGPFSAFVRFLIEEWRNG